MKPFSWDAAKPYRSDAAAAARLPPPSRLSAAEAEKAQAVRHRIPGTDQPLRCDACRAEILGPRFECIHCPGRYTLCFACEPAAVSSGRAHPERHVFRVYLRDEADGARGGSDGSRGGSSGDRGGSGETDRAGHGGEGGGGNGRASVSESGAARMMMSAARWEDPVLAAASFDFGEYEALWQDAVVRDLGAAAAKGQQS